MRRCLVALPAVVFVSTALLTGTASAETTLLAEFLANSAAITTGLAGEIAGSFKLEDTETIAGAASVDCTWVWKVEILASNEPDGGGLMLGEFVNLGGTKIGALGGTALLGTGAGSDCRASKVCAEGTTASPIEVYPIGMPWTGVPFLMENGEILVLISATSVGYELLCLVLGINTEDTCTQTDGELLVQNDAVTGDADTPSGSKVTPNATCTQSAKATGVIESTETSTMTLASAELLTVSSM